MSAPASRRGSTVREPVPTSFRFGGESSAPAGAPQLPVEPEQPAPSSDTSSTDSEEANRPRRAGWWSKRVLGKG
jgi:hypothetical protein